VSIDREGGDVRIETGTQLLLAEVDRQVATVTFNDPARHNALGLEMQRAMVDVAADLDRDPDVRVVVLRGAGERAFAAGADIDQLSLSAGGSRSAWTCWREIGKPVIAMIDGYCIGGGLLMALHADLRICSDRSVFSIPAARLGAGYGSWGVRAVLRVVGPAVAADLLYTARKMTAAEAAAAGLVTRVVPADDLARTVRVAADEIAANAPLTIRTCKAAIRHETAGAVETPEEVQALVRACFASQDYEEGRAAFSAKRDPVFRGV